MSRRLVSLSIRVGSSRGLAALIHLGESYGRKGGPGKPMIDHLIGCRPLGGQSRWVRCVARVMRGIGHGESAARAATRLQTCGGGAGGLPRPLSIWSGTSARICGSAVFSFNSSWPEMSFILGELGNPTAMDDFSRRRPSTS